MSIIRWGDFREGYNEIIDSKKTGHDFMLLDFGVYKLQSKSTISVQIENEEYLFMLLEGSIVFEWDNNEEYCRRVSCFDENPDLLHVSKGTKVTIHAKEDSEVIFVKTENKKSFKSKYYSKQDCKVDIFGKGILNETAVRKVRTVFDYSNAPYSNLVIGEVLNCPGKWSSYPPHAHDQPEFYYYRFQKPQGFGCSFQGEEVFKVTHNDTVLIPGGFVHPQCAAPGYPMYYCWVIRHLPHAVWTSRDCVPEHQWLIDNG